MPAPVREKVLNELKNGLKLTSFVPHPDIEDKELTGKQSLVFNVDGNQFNGTFFEINGHPYDPTRIDRTLMLGGADEWTLKSNVVSHPFHIHVTIGRRVGKVTSVNGPSVLPDLDMEQALDNPPDVLMIPGGVGTWPLLDAKADPERVAAAAEYEWRRDPQIPIVYPQQAAV